MNARDANPVAAPRDVDHDPRPLPLVRWSAWMIGVAVICGGVAVSLVPLWASDDASRTLARKAIVAATVVTTAASLFGFVPVTLLRRLGGVWAAFAWMAGVPFRFGLSLAGAVALATVGGLPVAATVLTMVVVYVALLATETILMVRFTNASPATEVAGDLGNDRR